MTETKLNYGRVSNLTWREVWIVGGGKSVNEFDFHRVLNRTVVCVNDAILKVPRASDHCIFSLDQNWIRKNRDLLALYRREKYLALPLETWPDLSDIPGATYLRWSHADGLSDDPGVICTGCNSGYGALNLAYLKGAKEIHLVGYDMDPDDNDQYQFWAPLFRNALPQLKEHGITVLNHNRASHIDAFPKVD